MNWNLGQIPLSSQFYFCSKFGSKELNHAAIGDLKNGGGSMKKESWPKDIPAPPFQMSASPGGKGAVN